MRIWKQEISVEMLTAANHLRGVTSGWVTGTARPVHLGRIGKSTCAMTLAN